MRAWFDWRWLTAVAGVLLGSVPTAAQPFAQLKTDFQVYSIAFSRDGGLVVAGSLGTKNPIIVWDVATGKQLHAFADLPGGPGQLWFPDNQTLLAAFTILGGEESGSTRVITRVISWDLTTGKRGKEIELPRGGANLAISPDGKWLVTRHKFPDTKGTVWDTTNWKEVATLEAVAAGDKNFASATFSADGGVLVTAGKGLTIKIWDTSTWKLKAEYKARHRPETLGVSSKGDLIAVRTTSIKPLDSFEIIEVATGKPSERFQQAMKRKLWYGGGVFSPDGKLLVVQTELYFP